jgi:Uncharacterized protein conserved in bacteria (DUF2188)
MTEFWTVRDEFDEKPAQQYSSHAEAIAAAARQSKGTDIACVVTDSSGKRDSAWLGGHYHRTGHDHVNGFPKS